MEKRKKEMKGQRNAEDNNDQCPDQKSTQCKPKALVFVSTLQNEFGRQPRRAFNLGQEDLLGIPGILTRLPTIVSPDTVLIFEVDPYC